MYSKLIVKGMTADGAHLLRNGCNLAILLLRYICSHSCTACAGPCMQYDDACISVHAAWSMLAQH